MNVGVAIESARAEDAEEVARIYVESWNLGFGCLMPPQVLDSDRIERWRADLGHGPGEWWVARSRHLMVGFAGIGPSRDPVEAGLGELDTIAVDPSRWRTGVGTALMRTALNALVSAGYVEAIVWTLAAYPRGQRFYESTGWQPDGGNREAGHQISFRHNLGIDLGVDRAVRA